MKEFADFVRKSNNSDFAQTPTWNDAVSLVGSMPSAQPKQLTDVNKKGDLISRQALLRQIDIDADGEPGYYGDTWKFIDTIKMMPTAQPNACENTCEIERKSNDMISRQTAVDAMEQAKEQYFDRRVIIGKMQDIVNNLPSAQPEVRTQMSLADCISRRAAIDAISKCTAWKMSKDDKLISKVAVVNELLLMPSTQPDVIRCKDCRFQDKGRNESESWNLCGYRPWLHVPTEDEHYCGYAERRTDE